MLTGHCGCGAVQFEITEPFEGAVWCHCTRCQRRSGNAYQGSARIAPGSFRFVAGEDLVRKWSPGGGLDKCFCGECGSAVYAADPETGEPRAARLGSIDGDPGVRPEAHQFVNYKAAWIDLPDDGLPRFGERVGEGEPL